VILIAYLSERIRSKLQHYHWLLGLASTRWPP
jgi:hypothetical protein